MPSINTPKGKFHYKTKALYPGIKPINKEISKENLFLFEELCNRFGIEYMLSYGTLLGAVREKDFISHDEDIDVVLKEDFRPKFLERLEDFRANGFELVRFDRRGLYSLMRKGEYIDLYFFRHYMEREWECSGVLIGDEFMQTPDEIELFGHTFKTHSNHIGMLECEYGEKWSVPVVYHYYNLSLPKKTLFILKEHIKDLLPDSVFHYMSRSSERKVEERYVGKLQVYRDRHPSDQQ